MIIPFSFQKGNKVAGCEDAPPITCLMYSVVCDGLGGAGSTKHTVLEKDAVEPVTRTSGYLGARIVSKCVAEHYSGNAEALFSAFNDQNIAENIQAFLGMLMEKIIAAFDENMRKWEIKPSHSKTLKDFPTTLASAIYYPYADGITILAVWAGDSRVYVLTPKKGLQLLSLDDAQNAENEMNSTSEMTNCISAGNHFRLNYALYKFNEPGIVFCCSDGCFDYLPSPLHFEWLILHTIYEHLPDSEGDKLGKALAGSIRDIMYETIGDDTTMAGIIVRIESSNQMKKIFRNRLDESDKLAIDMHESITKLKQVQNEKDAAQKKCRLSENKIFLSVHDAVCRALQAGSAGSMLRSKVMKMACYEEYRQREVAIEQEVDNKCEIELQKLRDTVHQTKKVCRDMLICDYLKMQSADEQKGGSSSLLGTFRLQKNRESTYNGWSNSSLMQAKQVILACINMYKHSYFRAVVPLPEIKADEADKYIQSQIGRLEAVLTLLETSELSFLDLWIQAYYSTDFFTKERNLCSNNPRFDTVFKQVLDNPESYGFVSTLSIRKIAEYSEQSKGLAAVREKYRKEKQRKVANIPEEFWANHKVEILDAILSESEFALRNLFGNTDVQIEQLLSYTEAKKTLEQIDKKIADIQCSIDRIWNEYKKDYQLFKQATEKGVCECRHYMAIP